MLSDVEGEQVSLPGPLAAEKCPAQLDLTTSLVGDRPRTLTPAHPDFPPFAWAWRHQDEWTAAEHRDYWIAHLHRWPRARQASTEMLAFALRAAKACGLREGDCRLDRLLGYEIEDVKRMLRRRHHGRRLDDVPEFNEPVFSDWPLPRIWTPGEPPPDPWGYSLEPGDFGIADDPRAESIRIGINELRAARSAAGASVSEFDKLDAFWPTSCPRSRRTA